MQIRNQEPVKCELVDISFFRITNRYSLFVLNVDEILIFEGGINHSHMPGVAWVKCSKIIRLSIKISGRKKLQLFFILYQFGYSFVYIFTCQQSGQFNSQLTMISVFLVLLIGGGGSDLWHQFRLSLFWHLKRKRKETWWVWMQMHRMLLCIKKTVFPSFTTSRFPFESWNFFAASFSLTVYLLL